MLRCAAAARAACRHQQRGFSQTSVGLCKSFQQGEWSPFRYSTDHGKALINGDTTFHEFLLYYFRVNKHHLTVDGRVGKFLEYAQKNMGYISMRSKAFNYSLYYFFGLMHRQTSNLLFNVRLQPLLMHKLATLIQYFHCGQTLQCKSIIRKPANFKHYWLWWMAKRNNSAPTWTYDWYEYSRKVAGGEIKVPKMNLDATGWRIQTYTAFTGGK